METKCLVTIIVPVYNVEDFIDQCLQSIVGQSYRNLEIILVDDGSTDDSIKICRRYAKMDSRIKIIEQIHGGPSKARNTGIQAANGAFYTFIDSDDWVEPCMIENLLKLLERYGADVACCNFDKCEGNLRGKVHKVTMHGEIVYTQKQAKECFMLENGFMCYAWNKIYKANIFENLRFPEGMLYEDITTTYKVIEMSNKIVFCDDCYYHYRIRESSITSTGFNETHYDIIKAIRHIKLWDSNIYVWLGCALYYLYFLDDMIIGGTWDWTIYHEFQAVVKVVKSKIRIFPSIGGMRSIQILGCYYMVHVYRLIYIILQKLRRSYAKIIAS